MIEGFYEKSVECPICKQSFVVTRVKSNACKVISRDTDYCINYGSINPLFYLVWVCENCGYAALEGKFHEISDSKAKQVSKEISSKWFKHKNAKERKVDKAIEAFIDTNCLVIQNVFSPKWVKKRFSGLRNVDTAIESFKLAYYNGIVKKATFSELAKISIRIAWLYRLKNDPREKKFLENTLSLYRDVYERERPEEGQADECICMYMIGELCLRVDEYKDAVFWFGKLIRSPLGKENPMVIQAGRDRMEIAKEKYTEKEKESKLWDF